MHVIPITVIAVATISGAAPGTGPDTACIVMDAPATGRLSPLDSVSFTLNASTVKICYGRPSSRGRTMIGGRHVPFGKLWRTGANEPTMIHTTVSLSIAGIQVGPGSYSLYTIPDRDAWRVIINGSITQWGHIAEYTYRVRQQEIGEASLPHERTPRHIETFTMSVESVDGEAIVYLEWERSRIAIPFALLDSMHGLGRMRR